MDLTPDSLGCALSTAGLDDRRAAWREMEAAIVDREPTDDGFRVRFGQDPSTGDRLRALVAGERECCGWASWTVSEAGDHWVLDVSGPPARIAPLASAFGLGGHERGPTPRAGPGELGDRRDRTA